MSGCRGICTWAQTPTWMPSCTDTHTHTHAHTCTHTHTHTHMHGFIHGSNMPGFIHGSNMPGFIHGSNMPGFIHGSNMPGFIHGSNMPGNRSYDCNSWMWRGMALMDSVNEGDLQAEISGLPGVQGNTRPWHPSL